MSTIAPASPAVIASALAEEISERAQALRREADRLDLEAAFARGQAGKPQPRWQDVIRDGWDHRDPASPAAGQGLAASALAHALRGESLRAHQLAAQAACESSGDFGVSIGVAFARAIAWLDEGDCSAAYEILASQFACHPTTDAARYLIEITGVFAETASRVNETDAARKLLDRWRPLFVDAPAAPRHEFDLASALLEVASPRRKLEDLLMNGTGRSPLTTARLHLALGMLLRRHRNARESRPHLLVAAELFVRCGARPWLAIVASELRAAGVRQDATAADSDLSPQEATIVQLAAQGLSNREIGERLFLSPRTVGSHLYRIFPKLGITSRHQLTQ